MVEQSNPGGSPWMLIILAFGCASAEVAVADNVPRPASTRTTPARTTQRPIKIRRLKKADFEVDFFFMWTIDVTGFELARWVYSKRRGRVKPFRACSSVARYLIRAAA